MKILNLNKRNRRLAFVLFSALLALSISGCSKAGETDADIEQYVGIDLSESSVMTSSEALEKAVEFVEAAKPNTFTLSLMSEELQEIDGYKVYTIQLTTGGGENETAFEPALAVDPENGIIYSYYPDGTLTLASDDEIWSSLNSGDDSVTPEEQQNLLEASQYADEITEAGTAEYVLTLKTGQYAYADDQALYIGYEGEIQQTLFHNGNEGVSIGPLTLIAKDMNFDGYEDIMLCSSSGMVNNYYYLWLYDEAEGNFVAYSGFENLSSPTANSETKQITTYERGSAVDYLQEVWEWNSEGTLTRVSESKVESDTDGNVTITTQKDGSEEESFTVTSDQYQTASELTTGTLVDFCITKYGDSDQRSFIFEGMETVSDVTCYSIIMTESDESKVRFYVDSEKTYMVMLDSDLDGTPEETININD